MLRFIACHAVYQCIVVFTIMFKGPELFGFKPHHLGYDEAPTVHYTMVCVWVRARARVWVWVGGWVGVDVGVGVGVGVCASVC